MRRSNRRQHAVRHLRPLSTLAAVFALSGAIACQREPTAEIRYTEYGIAHVRAPDYESVGFGQGYAQARDNFCTIERGMLGMSGEVARYFGPEGTGSSLTGGVDNVSADLYFKGQIDSQVVEHLVAQAAPLGPRNEVREIVRGYVRGFNEYFGQQRALSCSDEPWLRAMTEIDVYRRVYAVSTYLGLGFSVGGITSAEPPLASSEPTASRGPLNTQRARAQLAALRAKIGQPGSNAVAISGAATDTGGGINVANPHLPWDGDMHWWQTQLTIPGGLNVSGAALLGVPLVVMGHTSTTAWSITMVESAHRFTFFELELSPDSPTSYLVDGVAEPMQQRDVSVQVKRPDGSLETVTKAQYWTRFGPVVGSGLFMELPPWTASEGGEPGHAYVVRDANATNMRMLNTLFGFNHARDVGDVLHTIRETQGVPWWTVIAADAEGETLFSQIHVVPNVSDEHAANCNTEIGAAIFEATGIAILDGARSACAWQTDADAVEPGIFGPGSADHPRMPVLLGSEYFENSNDSYWLPNDTQRITGLARILGDEATPRSLRTRGALTEITEQLAKGPFTRELMQRIVLSNRSHAAELAVDDTVRACRSLPAGVTTNAQGEAVDVREACEVLSRWDQRMNIDSPGALLFDHYWRRVIAAARYSEAPVWAVAFDPADPVNTPHTLITDGPIVPTALADAVSEFAALHWPLAALLGDHQYVVRGGRRIPLGGGGGADGLGVFNILSADPSEAGDYTEATDGSGYIHVVQFDGTGCPDASSLVTYSQSADVSSPHHSDQTHLYSQKRWVKDRFCEDDIQASPEYQVIGAGLHWTKRDWRR